MGENSHAKTVAYTIVYRNDWRKVWVHYPGKKKNCKIEKKNVEIIKVFTSHPDIWVCFLRVISV